MEKSGVIRRQVALLDRERLNLGVTVFVAIRTREHNAEWLDRFAAAVEGFAEVMGFYRMSGDIDYLLRVVVPDIAAYDGFYKRLIATIELHDVSSSFAMEEIQVHDRPAPPLRGLAGCGSTHQWWLSGSGMASGRHRHHRARQAARLPALYRQSPVYVAKCDGVAYKE